MVKRPLYLQLCAIFAVSLLAFAGIAYFVVNTSGHNRYEQALFQKTSTLAALLLPDADANPAEQEKAVADIAKALDFEITLWGNDDALIASTREPAELSRTDLEPGKWQSNAFGTRYATVLADGRAIVVELDRMALPDDGHSFGLSFLLLAAFITLTAYPIIRHVTRRLERLQQGVERIGSGNLGARVEVKGKDEVALLAASFNSAAEQIESLVAAQRLLLANASHELRTPLARIRLGIEMLQRQDDPKRRAAMQEDIREIDSLIDELILMTRIDRGIGSEAFDDVDLLALVAEEATHYDGCKVTGQASEMQGDRRLLQHLIRNLLDNAYAHGKLPVEVRIEESDEAVELRVIDGGEGIPENERERVFHPFYRGKDKQSIAGSGLGLPLVKKITEAHGGNGCINNTNASTICIAFPLQLFAR